MMLIWMIINLTVGMPIIFSQSVLLFSGPYMSLIASIFSHAVIIRKFHGKHGKEILSLKSICIFFILLVSDISVGAGATYIMTHAPENFKIIARAFPITIIMFTHILLFYFLNIILTSKKIKSGSVLDK